jgi:homoserine kinase
LLAGMMAGGALAVCWSGSGPALLGISRGTDVHKVQAAAVSALDEADVPGQVLVLHPDMHGLIVDRDDPPEVYDFNADD